MANSKLLKEAIADAKAVRETAIANAKIALEEAFTPKLQSILSKKLQSEMEMDDEPEMMEDVNLQLSEDEIVQEVARRVAKRINEAARAQKKADKLLGRDKK